MSAGAGEKNWSAKLTEEQALRIIVWPKRHVRALANELGISYMQAWRIRTGQRWGYLHDRLAQGSPAATSTIGGK